MDKDFAFPFLELPENPFSSKPNYVIDEFILQGVLLNYRRQSIYYYEWNKNESKWLKLRQSDPDLTADLPPGKFDGQIIEVVLKDENN